MILHLAPWFRNIRNHFLLKKGPVPEHFSFFVENLGCSGHLLEFSAGVPAEKPVLLCTLSLAFLAWIWFQVSLTNSSTLMPIVLVMFTVVFLCFALAN